MDNFKDINHEELKKHIVSIHKSANKNYQLTQQLLSWSLKQQNGFNLIKTTINVNQMLNDIIDNLYALLLQKNITIINNCDQFISFELDKDIISKVIHNLLANAIKFSNRDAFIDVNFSLIDHQLNIEVLDRGKGINEKDLVSLNNQNSAKNLNIFKFEKNRQGGFGLFYSKELMELHQGRLIFDSVLNEGTRARIELVS